MSQKYYKVRLNRTSEFKVNSLAEVKKLIRGSDNWEVSHFKAGKTIASIECIRTAWKGIYDIHQKYKWRSAIDATGKLCLAIRKSRIAK